MAREAVTVTLDSDLLESARQIAQKQNRTFSNFVEVVLMTVMKDLTWEPDEGK